MRRHLGGLRKSPEIGPNCRKMRQRIPRESKIDAIAMPMSPANALRIAVGQRKRMHLNKGSMQKAKIAPDIGQPCLMPERVMIELKTCLLKMKQCVQL